jgi:hypothetical protein
MDKAQKPSKSERYTPSSEPFRFYTKNLTVQMGNFCVCRQSYSVLKNMTVDIWWGGGGERGLAADAEQNEYQMEWLNDRPKYAQHGPNT